MSKSNCKPIILNEPIILLTVREVTDHLRISRDAVLRLCQSGQLKHTLLGPKTIRIFQSSVEELIAKGEGQYGK